MYVAIYPGGEESDQPVNHLLNRVRSEFIEMPGLRLRIDQAQRLWNLDRAICETVLLSLVEAKFLGRFDDEGYARLQSLTWGRLRARRRPRSGASASSRATH